MNKITVGIPVYNSENSIRQCINSVLNQTFSEYEIIISDNASTDKTETICKDFAKQNPKIKYIKQPQNLGYIENFRFILNSCNSKYFVWISADDLWEPSFLEKNLSILEKNPNIIGSVGKIGILGHDYHRFDLKSSDNFLMKSYKQLRLHFLSFDYVGTDNSNYQKRIKKCLKSRRYGLLIFSLFRTETLKKVIDTKIIPWDWGLILLILKYGNIHVMDEILQRRNFGGISNTNSISLYNQKYLDLRDLFFPKLPFTIWCYKNLGKKIFLENFLFFIKLNISGILIIFYDSIKYFKNNKKIYYFEKDLLPK